MGGIKLNLLPERFWPQAGRVDVVTELPVPDHSVDRSIDISDLTHGLLHQPAVATRVKLDVGVEELADPVEELLCRQIVLHLLEVWP